VAALAAGILEVPSSILCLWVPDASSRRLLIGALLLRPLSLLASCWFILSTAHRQLALGTALLFLVAGWVLWMCFLRQLALCVKEVAMGDEAVRLLGSGFVTLVLA